MGWGGASIGDFTLMVHDSVYDYVKQNRPKEYYEKYVVELEFSQLLEGFKNDNPWIVERNCNEWEVKIPLLRLGKIVKLKKNYRFEWDMDLIKLLWDEIQNRGFVVEGYVCVKSYYTDENGKNIWKYYYLTSNIGEEPIKLQSSLKDEEKNMLHKIENYEQHIWIIKNGLDFYTMMKH